MTGRLTPPQIKVLEHMRSTGQCINLDATGRAFMIDGTQVNALTVRALVKKGELEPCGSDLLGDGVAAYATPAEERVA